MLAEKDRTNRTSWFYKTTNPDKNEEAYSRAGLFFKKFKFGALPDFRFVCSWRRWLEKWSCRRWLRWTGTPREKGAEKKPREFLTGWLVHRETYSLQHSCIQFRNGCRITKTRVDHAGVQGCSLVSLIGGIQIDGQTWWYLHVLRLAIKVIHLEAFGDKNSFEIAFTVCMYRSEERLSKTFFLFLISSGWYCKMLFPPSFFRQEITFYIPNRLLLHRNNFNSEW